MNKLFQIVVAATKDGGIGKDGGLPWKLPGDMSYFRELTKRTRRNDAKNAVIMGRRTWGSIPDKFRPLSDRLNVILTRSSTLGGRAALPIYRSDQATTNVTSGNVLARKLEGLSDTYLCGNFEDALALLSNAVLDCQVENVFVIGGGQVYKEAVASPHCQAIHLTLVDAQVDCDTQFPAIDPQRFKLWSASEPGLENNMRYTFLCYVCTGQPEQSQNGGTCGPTSGSSAEQGPEGGPVLPCAMASRHEEYQYLDLVADVMKKGVFRPDRTGTGTYSKFGCSMRFNLRHSFPLLTTKRVFWRGVVEELLWFISGNTSANALRDKNIHIWDGNSSREYLDSIGLTEREEGDLGPVYGFQWRHFGAEYKDMHTDYSGQGVDQLADLIHRIKTNPNDRRLLLTAWNPAAIRLMALPPCHMFCQFFVAHGELSCLMYQRSCDLGLGVPFNIASYSLLTRMVAQVCGLAPGEFIHMMGDAHVYANHVEPLQLQLQNKPRPFPEVRINPSKKDIDSFTFEDFELLGYAPHKKIEMKMAV